MFNVNDKVFEIEYKFLIPYDDYCAYPIPVGVKECEIKSVDRCGNYELSDGKILSEEALYATREEAVKALHSEREWNKKDTTLINAYNILKELFE